MSKASKKVIGKRETHTLCRRHVYLVYSISLVVSVRSVRSIPFGYFATESNYSKDLYVRKTLDTACREEGLKE